MELAADPNNYCEPCYKTEQGRIQVIAKQHIRPSSDAKATAKELHEAERRERAEPEAEEPASKQQRMQSSEERYVSEMAGMLGFDEEDKLPPDLLRQLRSRYQEVEHVQELACMAYLGVGEADEQVRLRANPATYPNLFVTADVRDVDGDVWEVKNADSINAVQHAHGQADFQRVLATDEARANWQQQCAEMERQVADEEEPLRVSGLYLFTAKGPDGKGALNYHYLTQKVLRADDDAFKSAQRVPCRYKKIVLAERLPPSLRRVQKTDVKILFNWDNAYRGGSRTLGPYGSLDWSESEPPEGELSLDATEPRLEEELSPADNCMAVESSTQAPVSPSTISELRDDTVGAPA